MGNVLCYALGYDTTTYSVTYWSLFGIFIGNNGITRMNCNKPPMATPNLSAVTTLWCSKGSYVFVYILLCSNTLGADIFWMAALWSNNVFPRINRSVLTMIFSLWIKVKNSKVDHFRWLSCSINSDTFFDEISALLKCNLNQSSSIPLIGKL